MLGKILIVDDDQEIRKITGIYLENEGFEVIKAEDGEQALKAVEEIDIDLVLTTILQNPLTLWNYWQELSLNLDGIKNTLLLIAQLKV